MALRIRVIKKKNYVYVVQLSGELDTDTSPQLREELGEIIDEKTKAVILDMAELDYISSAGIGVVIETQKTLEQQDAKFAMVNLQPAIKRVFDVMKILPIIDIFHDMPEADKYIDQIIKEETEKQST